MKQPRPLPVALAVATLFGMQPQAFGLPQGAKLVAGQATITQPNGTQLDITQGSRSAIVNWRSFGIGAGERVNLAQPQGGLALFRVTGNEASGIFGSLNASGKLFLVNPNGVLFGASARVDVGSLTATTLGIADADFNSARLRFAGDSTAGVENRGDIRAADQGSVVLLGRSVANSGSIDAPRGSVALGAGSAATLDVYGNGLVRLNLTGGAVGARVDHSGRIVADGGVATLAARGAAGGSAAAINVSGLVRASSLIERDGAIFLSGGDNGRVNVSGTLDASGVLAGTKGGRIELTGHTLALQDSARLDASGPAGGGTVLVGGGASGADAQVPNAAVTMMQPGATITASATERGDGGRVVLWADQGTQFAGRISARGGAQGGNGGWVETSGKQVLEASGEVDAAAPLGNAGQWLLDPTDVTISTAATTGGSFAGGVFTPAAVAAATLNTGTIQNALNAGTSVTVNTTSAGAGTGNITVANAITKTGGTVLTTVFTLNAAGSIALNAPVAVSGGGVARLGVALNAGGNVVFGANGSLSTSSGNVTITGRNGITLAGIDTGASGTLTLNSSAGNGTIDVAPTAGAARLAVGGALSANAGTGSLDFTGLASVSAATLGVTAFTISSNAPVSVTGTTTLTANPAGLIAFRDSNSRFGGTINASGANLRMAQSSGDIRLGTISVNTDTLLPGLLVNANGGNLFVDGPLSLGAAHVALSASGNVQLARALSTTAADGLLGRAINVSAGGLFVNNAGANALAAANGSWTVRLETPQGNTFGGLLSGNKAVWSTPRGNAISDSGNRYTFAVAPSVFIASQATAAQSTKVFGNTGSAVNVTIPAGRALVDPFGGAFTDYAGVTYSGSVAYTSTGFPAAADVGSYPLTASSSLTTSLAGYGVSALDGVYRVTTRTISLSTPPPTRTYGDANPTSGNPLIISGSLAGGDSITSVGLTSPATLTSNAGQYNLDVVSAVFGSGKATNYNIVSVTLVRGLTVAPRALTLTPDAASRIYGNANPGSGTASGNAGGLVNGDSVSSVALASPALQTSNVGAYNLTGSSAVFGTGLASNYAISYATRASGLTITPRPLTLTADAASRIYGNANPSTGSATGNAGGLVNGDSVTSVALTTPATVTSNVGSYALTGSSALFGSGVASNYAISYATRASGLTITPRPITLAPQAQLRLYGNANPTSGTATVTLGSLVGTDRIVALTLSSPAVVTSNLGSYSLSGSNAVFGSGSSANYAISYTSNATGLVVAARPLTLTADAVSRSYGDANPASSSATGNAGGLVNGDAVSSVTLVTNATPSSDVGSYATLGSNAVFGSGLAGNYTISYTANAAGLNVTPRALTVTPNLTQRAYGNLNPARSGATVTSGTLVNGNQILTVALTSPAVFNSDVGFYSLSGSNAALAVGSISNYALTYTTNPTGLQVLPRPITVSVVSRSRAYGDANPTSGPVTPSANSLIGTDSIASAALSSPATAGSNIGIYALTGSNAVFSSGKASNYQVTYVPASLFVNPRALTLTPDPVSRSYGDANPGSGSASGNAGGLANGDRVASVTLTTPATVTSNVGSYVTTAGAALFSAGLRSNYNITYATHASGLNVTPRALALTPVAVARIYGDANPGSGAATGSAGGLVNGDTVANVALATPAVATSNVGAYDLTGSSAAFGTGLASNYNIIYATNAGALSVTPRALTLTADAASRIYGDANPSSGTATGNAGGLVNGDSVASVALTTPVTVTSNVGSYALTASSAVLGNGVASNYTISYATRANGLTISQRALTLTADAASRIYGDANPATGTATGAVGGLVNGDSVASVALTTPVAVTSNVGTYDLTGSSATFGNGLASNYTVSYATRANGLTITPRALTLTADAASRIYGDANPSSGTATGNAGGLVNGDSVTSVALSTPAAVTSNVGTYDLTGSGATFGSGLASNYTIAYATRANGLNITTRALTLAADAASRIYGDANPATGTATGNAGGLVNGDSVTSVALATPATVTSNVGSYNLTGSSALFGTGLASNYTISYATRANGLTIATRALTLTADAASRVYGDANPGTGTATGNAGGLASGDSVTSVVLTTPAVPTSNVGSYDLTGSSALFGNGLASNYTISYAIRVGGLTVTPRALTLTTDAASRVYGDANPGSGTASGNAGGLINGDIVTSVVPTTPAVPTSNVGSYDLTGSSALFGSGLASNYTISYATRADGLTFTPRALTLTADAATRIYGDANPGSGTASGNVGGLVNGDSVANVALTTPATPSSNAGSYDLTGAGAVFGSGLASNYAIAYATNAGALSVTPRALTLTADATARSYGNANPGSGTASGNAGGLVNGDSVAGVTLTTSATVTSKVGGYDLDSSSALFGSGLASNYTISYATHTGALSVTPRALTLTADAATRNYGNANPSTGTASGSAGGLVNGDIVASVALTTPATVTSKVGAYDLAGSSAVFGSGLASNYTINYTTNTGALSITPRTLTLTPVAASRAYGDANPGTVAASGSAGGLVNGDTIATVALATPANASSGVGVYATSGSNAAFANGLASNYDIAYAGNAAGLSVVPRGLGVAASPRQGKVAGSPDPVLGYFIADGNLVNGDSLSGALERPAGETPGAYTIGRGSLSAGPNYALGFSSDVFNIVARTPTVTLDRNPSLGQGNRAQDLGALFAALPATAAGPATALSSECVREEVLDRDGTGAARLVNRGVRLPAGVVANCN